MFKYHNKSVKIFSILNDILNYKAVMRYTSISLIRLYLLDCFPIIQGIIQNRI